MPFPEGSSISQHSHTLERRTRTPRIRPQQAVPEDVWKDPQEKAEHDTPQIRLQRAIQLRRQDTNMTVEDVAEPLRTTPDCIARIEQGEVDPSYSYLVKIAKAMDADIEIVFRPREEEKEQELTGQDTPKPDNPKQA
jgi:ribosome-binding protein aMBF1 (putative translation factor)